MHPRTETLVSRWDRLEWSRHHIYEGEQAWALKIQASGILLGMGAVYSVVSNNVKRCQQMTHTGSKEQATSPLVFCKRPCIDKEEQRASPSDAHSTHRFTEL